MTEKKVEIIKYTLTRLLAGREHSKYELLKKLLQKGFERELCIEWIDKFEQNNLQSDYRFTESLVRGRVNKGIGELRIRNDLKEHQISSEIVACAMAELSIDWFELVEKVYVKKYVNHSDLDQKEKRKRQRFLYSRGFTYEQIRYALESSRC